MYDVIVVGGGNAALCAALTARHLVPKVLLLERAPIHMRGGNTRHTRNIRCVQKPNAYSSEEYADSEFLEDLIGVTGGPANLDLARANKPVVSWRRKSPRQLLLQHCRKDGH